MLSSIRVATFIRTTAFLVSVFAVFFFLFGIQVLVGHAHTGVSHGPTHYTTHHDSIPNFAEFPTIESAQNGAWSNPATWDWDQGRVPTTNDIVLITHTVSYDASNGNVDTIGIRNGGTLDFIRTANTKLTVSNILVTQSGTLHVGTQSHTSQHNRRNHHQRQTNRYHQ